MVLKKRAIKFIVHSGMELSKHGVLTNSKLDIGRVGAIRLASLCETSISREASKKDM